MNKIILGLGIFTGILLLACDDTTKNNTKTQDAEVMDMSSDDMKPTTLDMKVMDLNLVDMLPTEPNPCVSDDQCFEGRICLDGVCGPTECKYSNECPADKPICIGVLDENQVIQRGRCGNCTADSDCFEPSTCVPFANGLSGGICSTSDTCVGTLDCPPAARNVMRGPQSLVCLDRSTSAQESICVDPFKCASNNDCPEGLKCLPSGQCATIDISDNCRDSLECGFGEVCRSDIGKCGPCQQNTDCGPNQACQSGACVEIPGACIDDDSCLGNRQCVLGECNQPTCQEDEYGPNDSFATVKEIVGDRIYRQLMSCGDDWFSFLLPPEMNALVAVRQLDRGSNLGLIIYNDEQVEIGRSVSSAALEGVRLRESAAPRTIYVKVFQEQALGAAAYQLEISYTPSNETICLDDPFELVSPDNDLNHARLIRGSVNERFPTQVSGQICKGDDDFYCFQIADGERLSISGVVELGDALIVGTLYDPNGDVLSGVKQVGRWAADLNATDIDTVLENGGLYCLGLSVDEGSGTRLGQGRYKLKFNAVSPQVATLCGQSQQIEIDGRRGSDVGTLSGDNHISLSCANSNGPEKAYYFNVTEPSLVVARVAGVASGTLGAPVLALKSECELGTEIACSEQSIDFNNPYISLPNPAILRAAVNPPVDPISNQSFGTYTLIVDGIDVGDTPSYQVDIELRPLAPAPINDRCERASELQIPADGVLSFQGNLDQALDETGACVGQGAPDVFYHVRINQPSRVLAQATSIPADFPVAVYLKSSCSGAVTECGFGFDEVVPAGDYILVVDGIDAQSRGRFEVQLAVDPIPAASVNDTCANAIDLEGLSGQLIANTRGATDDYQLNRQNTCTRDNTMGGDLVYRLNVQANRRVTISVDPTEGWDTSLYVLSSCDGNLEQSCLVGQDGALREQVVFTPAQNGSVFVIVDGVNGEFGEFNLSWNIE